jgi:anti-sigma factor RsiW
MAETACKGFREKVHDLVDGRLAPQAAEELRRHLSACPSCAAEEREIRRVGDLLRVAAAGAAADPRLAAMWTRVRAGIEERREWEAGRRSWLRRFVWLPVAAALAVAFFVFYPSVVGRGPLTPGDFRVSVESIESGEATVALLDEGEGLPRVIWIIEDTERG